MDKPVSAAARVASARHVLRAVGAAAAEPEAAGICADFPGEPQAFALYADCAVAQGNWQKALERWQDCQQRFPQRRAVWRMGLATALRNADRLAEAEAEYAAMLADQPDLLPAAVGLAMVVGKRRPQEAEACWRDVARLNPGRQPAGWVFARAQALTACGQLSEAAALLRALLSETPDFAPALALLTSLLVRSGNRAEAAHETASGLMREGGPAPAVNRIRLLNWLDDVPRARAGFAAALDAAGDVAEMSSLFDCLPEVFESFEREEMWRALRLRLAAIASRDDPRASCLALRIDLALRDYDGFLANHRAAGILPVAWEARFNRAAEILRAPAFPDFAAPKIFAIGLSKTGTVSLDRALERLGFLHAHFQNPFSNVMLAEDDFALFDATSDTPATLRFETLFQQYPNARFIVTERPFEDWLPSFTRFIQHRFGTADFAELRRRMARRNQTPFGLDTALMHAALFFNHAGPRAAWEAHAGRVARCFAGAPPGKLLRLNVFQGHGWAELCRFLDREAPAEPYPWLNRGGGGAQG